MALKIRAAEGLNRRVYYDFYGVHSKWTPEHEQAWKEENQARMLCAILSFHFPQLPQILRHYKPWHKKRDKNCKAMCSIHLFTNCGKHRRLCGLRYHCLQLWLGCQWGIWGAGWGRQEGLGAVIKLPLFPPGSLQGSNSALIGQQVTRQPRDPVRLVTPGDRWEHSSFIILNLSETSG